MNETSVQMEYSNAKLLLNRLLNQIDTRSELLWDNRSDLCATWNRSKETSEILKDMKAQAALNNLPPKAKAVSKLFAYLGLVESLGVTLMDMALILLIANGEEMHIHEGGIRHVSTLRELRKLNLFYKAKFLKAYKLQFVAGVIDSSLRNDIAHLKFKVEEDGAIVASDGRQVSIDDVLTRFWERVGQIISIFEEIKFIEWVEKGGSANP